MLIGMLDTSSFTHVPYSSVSFDSWIQRWKTLFNSALAELKELTDRFQKHSHISSRSSVLCVIVIGQGVRD